MSEVPWMHPPAQARSLLSVARGDGLQTGVCAALPLPALPTNMERHPGRDDAVLPHGDGTFGGVA